MHTLRLLLFSLCLTLLGMGDVFSQITPQAETLAEVTASTQAAVGKAIQKEWHYDGFRFVSMGKAGQAPNKGQTAALLKAMTVTPANCVLTLSGEKFCTLSLGKKKVRLRYTYDTSTRLFRASLGPFAIDGKLMMDGEDLLLVYSRSELFMMMRFLCPSNVQKSVDELAALLDASDGLTLGIRFK